MAKNRKRLTLVAALALALLAQFINPSGAYAGGRTPPAPSETAVPTEVVTTESPAAESTPSTQTRPGVDLIPTDLTLSDSLDNPVEPAFSTPGPAAPSDLFSRSRMPSLRDVLRNLPENTGLVVLHEMGKPLPLVSQAAAQAIIESDPVWCPAGQPPTPGLNGCTITYSTLADLIATAGSTIAANGTIWITAGPVADSNAIVIDGAIYTNWANYSLSLQGGWSGNSGDSTVNSISAFSVPITISNWNNTLFLGNLATDTLNIQSPNGVVILTDVRTLNTHIDSPRSRIDVYNSRGNLHVNNADINNNGLLSSGININRLDGNVTIRNSTFHGNGYDGVWMNHVNNVAIENSQFDLNLNNGLSIQNASLVTVSNSNFSGNTGSGLSILQASSVNINQSFSIGNTGGGMIMTSSTNTPILINNVTIDESSGFGLGIVTNGGNVVINNSSFSSTMAGGSNPYFGWGDGADIFSNGGTITITQSHFFANAFDGLFAVGTGNITITQSAFTQNAINGLNVVSTGNVTLTGSNFDNPGGTGVSISDAGSVTFSGGTVSNNSTGLYVYCTESVTFNPAPLTAFTGNLTNIVIDPACPIDIDPPRPQTFLQTQGETFALDCVRVNHRYVVRLANGDRGEIFCPVTGEATIDRVDNTTLPANLPAGYTYASAFKVDITHNDQEITVVTEGGYIVASFGAQYFQSGSTYSILYWDESANTWIPLKNILLDDEGKPVMFPLYPGSPADGREIRSGVAHVTKDGVARVEVTTNFPGIFVLAQH